MKANVVLSILLAISLFLPGCNEENVPPTPQDNSPLTIDEPITATLDGNKITVSFSYTSSISTHPILQLWCYGLGGWEDPIQGSVIPITTGTNRVETEFNVYSLHNGNYDLRLVIINYGLNMGCLAAADLPDVCQPCGGTYTGSSPGGGTNNIRSANVDTSLKYLLWNGETDCRGLGQGFHAIWNVVNTTGLYSWVNGMDGPRFSQHCSEQPIVVYTIALPGQSNCFKIATGGTNSTNIQKGFDGNSSCEIIYNAQNSVGPLFSDGDFPPGTYTFAQLWNYDGDYFADKTEDEVSTPIYIHASNYTTVNAIFLKPIVLQVQPIFVTGGSQSSCVSRNTTDDNGNTTPIDPTDPFTACYKDALQRIMSQAGIQIVFLPGVTSEKTGNETLDPCNVDLSDYEKFWIGGSMNQAFSRDTHRNAARNSINVFLVRSNTTSVKGLCVPACYESFREEINPSFIMIPDHGLRRPEVLAHEMGHLLMEINRWRGREVHSSEKMNFLYPVDYIGEPYISYCDCGTRGGGAVSVNGNNYLCGEDAANQQVQQMRKTLKERNINTGEP